MDHGRRKVGSGHAGGGRMTDWQIALTPRQRGAGRQARSRRAPIQTTAEKLMDPAAALNIIGSLPDEWAPYHRQTGPFDRGTMAKKAARALQGHGLAILSLRREPDGAIVYLIKRAKRK